MKTLLLPIIFSLSLLRVSFAQDNLSLDLDDDTEPRKIENAFNGSTIVSGQSSNLLNKGILNFMISHRFGALNEGAFNLFGLDFSAIRIGFEYGINDKLNVGLGRSSLGKNYDAFLKYRFLTQTKDGDKNVPVSVVGFTSAAFSSVELRSRRRNNEGGSFSDVLVYTYQVIVSKEFSHKFSAQISPTLVHRNEVLDAIDDNNIYALGLAARYKIGRRMHINMEYFPQFNPDESVEVHNALAVGLDIVTGGHVFKVHLSNSAGLIEKEFVTNTQGDFFDGDIRLGFTIFRSFVLNKQVKGGRID